MNPLRNPNINYFNGWFFLTFQVAMNKSVFGVISDKKLILNRLGEMVRENLVGLGRIFPELYIQIIWSPKDRSGNGIVRRFLFVAEPVWSPSGLARE